MITAGMIRRQYRKARRNEQHAQHAAGFTFEASLAQSNARAEAAWQRLVARLENERSQQEDDDVYDPEPSYKMGGPA